MRNSNPLTLLHVPVLNGTDSRIQLIYLSSSNHFHRQGLLFLFYFLSTYMVL